jgi:hypothetical protein
VVQVKVRSWLARHLIPAALMALLMAAATAGAQDRDYRQVESPFQAELEYRINDELRPRVEVDGVRWIRLAVRTRDGNNISTDKQNPVFVETTVLTEGDPAEVHIILLFEDEEGRPLERLSCDPEKSGRSEVKEIRQKFKIDGRVLEATRKVYVYFEVIR